MRPLLLAAASIALSACLTIPAFTPPDAAGDDDALGVSITTEADSSLTANGPGYSIHFPASGFHYPDQITLGPDDVLGGATNPACQATTRTGIGLAPSNRVDGTDLATGPIASVGVIADGPAIVELDLSWTSVLTCPTSITLSGHSTFMLTPDGRVVRFDSLDVPTMTANAMMCACEGGAGPTWDLTSNLVATSSQFDRVVDRSLTEIMPSDTAAQDQVLCTFGPEHSIGFGFQQNQVRVHAVEGGNAFTYDFLTQSTTMLDPSMMIGAVSSAYVFGGGTGCSASVGKLLAFGDDPKLAVDGLQLATSVDGVYGGNDGGGNVGISVGTTTTLTATNLPIPAGFVVWLDFGVARSSFQITNPAQTGTSWFRTGTPKQKADSQLIVWFRDALPVGQTITIVAGND